MLLQYMTEKLAKNSWADSKPASGSLGLDKVSKKTRMLHNVYLSNGGLNGASGTSINMQVSTPDD